jgi:hypothetical protein
MGRSSNLDIAYTCTHRPEVLGLELRRAVPDLPLADGGRKFGRMFSGANSTCTAGCVGHFQLDELNCLRTRTRSHQHRSTLTHTKRRQLTRSAVFLSVEVLDRTYGLQTNSLATTQARMKGLQIDQLLPVTRAITIIWFEFMYGLSSASGTARIWPEAAGAAGSGCL